MNSAVWPLVIVLLAINLVVLLALVTGLWGIIVVMF